MGYTQDSYLSVYNSTTKYRLSRKRRLLLEQNAINRERLSSQGIPLRGRRPTVKVETTVNRFQNELVELYRSKDFKILEKVRNRYVKEPSQTEITYIFEVDIEALYKKHSGHKKPCCSARQDLIEMGVLPPEIFHETFDLGSCYTELVPLLRISN